MVAVGFVAGRDGNEHPVAVHAIGFGCKCETAVNRRSADPDDLKFGIAKAFDRHVYGLIVVDLLTSFSV
jgi:hypothetical protein